MINYYQRTVAHGVATNDMWLEEISAMMTQDIVGPSISPTGYSETKDFASDYVYWVKGNLSLINWPHKNSVCYAMGGRLGAERGLCSVKH